MTTGIRGTFVISWSQTETDGLTAAALDTLAVGAVWRWTGDVVRVDAAQDVLVLTGAEGAADIRKRAARMVRRLIGAAVAPAAQGKAGFNPGDAFGDAGDLPERGFILTDGLHSYSVTVIDVPETRARLVMFVDDIPPSDRDLWVVRLSLDITARAPGARAAGGVICFTPGTMIRTVEGQRRVDQLSPGDFIQTKDNGPQEVLWKGTRRMTGARLHAMPHLRPVRFMAGALGIGRPDTDLLVSPQHRMLIKGAAARALFNSDEVLVAAEDLVNDTNILVEQALREVTYIHILLAQHQVIWANGIETESFHPANTALDTVDPAQLGRLLEVLPGVDSDPHIYGDYARRNLSGPEAVILRHDLAA